MSWAATALDARGHGGGPVEVVVVVVEGVLMYRLNSISYFGNNWGRSDFCETTSVPNTKTDNNRHVSRRNKTAN